MRNAEALDADEPSDIVADETVNTDDVWSDLIESTFPPQTPSKNMSMPVSRSFLSGRK